MNATPPHDAMNRYLKDKSSEVTQSTLKNYETTLRIFCEWLCEEAAVAQLNALASDEIQQFKEWRLGKVKTITLKTGCSLRRSTQMVLTKSRSSSLIVSRSPSNSWIPMGGRSRSTSRRRSKAPPPTRPQPMALLLSRSDGRGRGF